MFFEMYESDLKPGEIIYDIENYSFDMLPYCLSDATILIEYIQFGFDSETKELMGLWGLCPKLSWIPSKLQPPQSIVGSIRFRAELESGKTIRLRKDKTNWKYFYDNDSGWFCMKRTENLTDESCVEIIKDVLIVLSEGKINAIWLKPKLL